MSSRRNRGGGGGHGGGGEERWLLPYSDMITLLLGLFIVLFAMSSLDAHKFDSLRDSLSQTFNGGQVLTSPGNVLPQSQGAVTPASTDAPSARAIQRAQSVRAQARQQYKQEAQQLKQLVKEQGLGRSVKVDDTQRGIVISLAGDALFDSGRSDLKPGVRTKLARIEKELQRFNRELAITGHTDGQPVPGDPWGNWRLSGDRAEAVAFFFFERGYEQSKVHFEGYGDQKPKVKPPKNNPQADIPENRRIEIVVLAPGANDGLTERERIADLAGAPVMSDALDSAIKLPADDLAGLGVVEDLANITRATNQ
jgi:chemotaxis protein MotB